MSDSASSEWQGSARFALRRALGAGGFGVVYEAFDRDRQERVALKRLERVSGHGLYLFKREFRALRDLAHRNLVSLYELIADGGHWYFTMELVAGCDFLAHVRRREDRRVEALRPALAQLAEGVATLHAAGKLHRDIKPSNVLVEEGGRVVLLDFGLVAELAQEDGDSAVLGTPGYMSPEQASGGELTPASDWYSVGAMLYEALADHLPFPGPVLEVLHRKLHEDAPPLRSVAPEAPRDLAQLCDALLARDPARRPAGEALLRQLASPHASSLSAEVPSPGGAAPLGRAAEWKILRAAWEAMSPGRPVVLHLHGASGVGKTTLAERFADVAGAGGRAPVLRGRCYQQESVPFQALDEVIDTLSGYLRRLPAKQVAALVPRDARLLVRLFPVLERVQPIAAARPRPHDETLEPQERRRRAFAALRELFERLTERTPVLIVLDDAQWGDPDSLAFFEELLQPPDPPAAALLLCARSGADSAFVSHLLARAREPGPARVVDVQLDVLADEDAHQLAAELVRQPAAGRIISSIVREARGNPLFIRTLADYVATRYAAAPGSLGELTLQDAMRARLAALPEAARVLLELAAVAGLPTDEHALARACAVTVPEDEPSASLHLLRRAHLLRPSTRRGHVEPYHDQVRVAVLGSLGADALRAHHHALGRALEALGAADPERLIDHFASAGDTRHAAHYARCAADQAAKALAFDRAAALHRRALALDPPDDAGARAAQALIAEALVNGGRNVEAAEAYLEAANGAAPAEALDRRRRAAEALMKSGHVERGLAILQQRVLPAFGMRLASTPRRALLSLLQRRLRIALRGTHTAPASAAPPPPELLRQIDLCWTAWTGLGMNDFIRAADFHALNLLLSLRAREPYRLARALTMEACFVASGGARTQPRSDRLLARARELAAPLEHPHLEGLLAVAEGLCAYTQGRFAEVHEPCRRGEALLRDCPGTAWERSVARQYMLESLVHTGRLVELSGNLQRFVAEAVARGDLFSELGLRTLSHLWFLAADDPDGAEDAVRTAMARYTRQGTHIPHFWEFYALAQIRLYRGDGQAALRGVHARWSELQRSLLLRLQVTRTSAHHLRGRCALCAALSAGADRPALIARAERDAAAITRERARWAAPLAALIRAGAAAQRGDVRRADELLAAAITDLDEIGLRLYAAAARCQLGALRGGDAGAAQRDRGERAMREQRVVDPRRFAALLVPGFPDRA